MQIMRRRKLKDEEQRERKWADDVDGSQLVWSKHGAVPVF
jgi:hypothetical protein